MNEEAKSGPIETLDASVITQLTQGEIGMQVETARRYPRSIQVFKEELTGLATEDKEIAASCFYRLTRRTKGGGQKVIEGPSVRMAEMALYSWRNSRVDARVVEVGATHVTAQATFMDLERNIGVRIEKRRRITYTDGTRYNDDMINLSANAAISFAFRDAVWRGIPRSHIKESEAAIKKVILGTLETLPARRKSALAYFADIEVTDKMILKLYNRKRVEDLTLEDVANLKMNATAIKTGETTVEALFGEGEAEVAAKSETDAAALDNAAADAKPEKTAEVKAEEEPEPQPGRESAPPLEMEQPAKDSPTAEQPPPAEAEDDDDEEEGWV